MMKKQKKVFGKNKNIEHGSRRGIPMKTVTMIEIGGAVVLIALLLLMYVLYTDGLTELKPKEVTYQYIGAQKVEYSGSARFRNQDGVQVSDGGTVLGVSNTPLICDEEKSLTLTCDMLLKAPGIQDGLVRIPTFTKVTEADGRITFERNGKMAQTSGGFLHDGQDVYVFLTPTVLTVGNVDYELGALSYAKVIYNQRVEFFDSTTGEDKVIALIGTDVYATCNTLTSTYKVDLGNDLFYMGNSDEMLFSIVDRVSAIEMK